MSKLIVRRAEPSEHAVAGQLAAGAFATLKPLLTPQNQALIEERIRAVTADDPTGILLVADLDGTLAGSVRYTAPGHGGHPIYPDRVAYVRSVAVSPHQRRRGIGAALVRDCIARARADRAEAVGLHVARANTVAVEMYLRMGFIFYRRAPHSFGIPYDAYLLRFGHG